MGKKLNENLHNDEKDVIKRLNKAIKDNEELVNPNDQIRSYNTNIALQDENISRIFFDNIGNTPILINNLIHLFNIDISNLLVSIINHMESVNLETIFYYISIFKMINGDLPANISLILSIVENQSNKILFNSRYNDTPDIINNFYGLAIISETIKMNMNIIDLNILKDLLIEELKHFNENKILYNYYLFNCINLLKKFNFNINVDKNDLLKRFNEIHINNLEYNEFIHNFYRLISISKLLDNHFDFKNVNSQYLKKLDKIFNELDVNNYNLTECSQLLLILDILALKEKYVPQIKLLLNKLIKYTNFFMSEIQDEDFSWKNDITAFMVEVKILYWTLITSVQYQSLIQKNFS